jgi:putative phage-type endonuclease
MIHFPVKQGSQEWHDYRRGHPNASEGENIITSKKWESTSGAARRRYIMRLLAERILGISLDSYVTPAMLHGQDWEPKARARYEAQYGIDVELCGYCMNAERTAGASPDAFVGEDGLLEIKCPELPQNHVGYLLSPDTLQDEYWVQVQFQLYITGRKWTDLISYFMNMPMVCVRITPHPEFQTKLDKALRLFINDLENYTELARARGVEFAEDHIEAAATQHAEWLTAEDAEEIIAARVRSNG